MNNKIKHSIIEESDIISTTDDIIMNTERIISPAEKSRVYMRDYKRRKYAENKEKVLSKNKAYYIKYKYGMSDDDMRKYDTLLPAVSRLRQSLDEIIATKPHLIIDLLTPYMPGLISAEPVPHVVPITDSDVEEETVVYKPVFALREPLTKDTSD